MGSLASTATPTSPMHPPTSTPLQPTWHGYVADTKDALLLFEAVLNGSLQRVLRRPHDRERNTLIRSGSIFIYEEDRSGIKRWTDGIPWSPSRILNNFLLYRQLLKPFPPGEKKRAKKIKREGEGDAISGQELSDGVIGSPATPSGPGSPAIKQESAADRDAERSLVGSLTDSYSFKPGGLVKKTMSVNVGGSHFHLVSYYTPEDVKAGGLSKPSQTHLGFCQPRHELTHQQNFRAPLDETDDTLISPHGYMQPRNQYIAAAQPPYIQQPAYPTQPSQYPGPSTYFQQSQHISSPYAEAQRQGYHMPPSTHGQQPIYQSMNRGQPVMHQATTQHQAQPQHQHYQQQVHHQQQSPTQHQMSQYSSYQHMSHHDMRGFPLQGGYQQSPPQMQQAWANQQG